MLPLTNTDTQRGGLQLFIAVHLLLKDWLTQKVLVGKGMISCYLYVCLSNFGSSDLLVSFCGRAEKRQFFKFVHFVLVAREWCWLQCWWLPTSQDGSLWSITISCKMTVLHTQFRLFFSWIISPCPAMLFNSILSAAEPFLNFLSNLDNIGTVFQLSWIPALWLNYNTVCN